MKTRGGFRYVRNHARTPGSHSFVGALIVSPHVPGGPGYLRPHHDAGTEVLEVTCWCEAEIVSVPASWIWQGRTAACPQPECQATDLAIRASDIIIATQEPTM